MHYQSSWRQPKWTFGTAHFMDGRCRRTTSTAWTGLVLMGLSSSSGSGMLRPVSTSWSMCQLTRDTNLMETLKGRSFPPSPGRVTSRSTCDDREDYRWITASTLVSVHCVQQRFFFLRFVSSSPPWVPQAVGWLCTDSSFHRRLASDLQRLSPWSAAPWNQPPPCTARRHRFSVFLAKC